MASRFSNLTNTIHIRDFVDSISPDPTKPGSPSYVEISSHINLFGEDDFSCSDVIVSPLRARLRAYVPAADHDMFTQDAFYYADGRFSTVVSPEGSLEILVHIFCLTRYYYSNSTLARLELINLRHPGDVSNFDQYARHLPTQWCPMVAIVGHVSGQDHDCVERNFTLRRC